MQVDERRNAGLVALDKAYRLMSEESLKKVWDVQGQMHHDLYMKNSLLMGSESALYESGTVTAITDLLKDYEGAFVIVNPVMGELVGKARQRMGSAIDTDDPYIQYPKLRSKTNDVVATWGEVDFGEEYSVPYELHHMIPRAYQRDASITDENFVLATRGASKREEVGTHEGLFHRLLSVGTGSLFSTVVPGSAGYFKRLIANAKGFDLDNPSSLPSGYEWLELQDFSKAKPLPRQTELTSKLDLQLEKLLDRSNVVNYEPRSILIEDLFTDPMRQLKVWKKIKTDLDLFGFYSTQPVTKRASKRTNVASPTTAGKAKTRIKRHRRYRY